MSQSSVVGTPRNFVGEEARRSTRIEKSVPLFISGQNEIGERFVEGTVTVSLNKHGCRYTSRQDYGVGSWVTIQVVGLVNSDPTFPTVRARVRSVHGSGNPFDLRQVGVELEKPGNVWGIPAPKDWLGSGEMGTSTPTFPPPPEAAPTPPTTEGPEFPKLQRVVVTPDGIISALRGKLEDAAEKAAQAAVAKEMNVAVREALSVIDDVRQSSVLEIQEIFPKQVEALRLSSKEESGGEMTAQWKEPREMFRRRAEDIAQRLEKQATELRRELGKAQEFVEKMTREIAPQVQARLNEAVTQATLQFDGTTARVVDRRYQLLLENTQIVTQEALLKLDARSAEAQAIVQNTVNSALGAFQRQTELHANMALAETKERAVAVLSSLNADGRAACDARRLTMETEVARSAERSMEQFRKGMKAFLYSCLVAAVGAVDEHSKSMLEGLLKDTASDSVRSKS